MKQTKTKNKENNIENCEEQKKEIKNEQSEKL